MLDWFFNIDWRDYIVPLTILLIFSIAIGDYLKDILSWIKLQWKNAIPLKRVYIVVACIIGVALIYLFATLYLQILLFISNPLAEIKIDTNFALAFLGTVTGLVALFTGFIAILRSETNENQNKIAIRKNEIAHDTNQITIRQNELADIQSETSNRQAHTAERNSEIAEQSLITDRINKAVAGLGKNDDNGEPILEIRIGAIYALERIAQDSIRDHVQIMEILCAYIRTNSSNDKIKTPDDSLREDITTILTIIRRRDSWEQGNNRLQIEKTQKMHFNFYNCYLKGAELYDANLFNTNFYKANLQNAWLNDADISKSRLVHANVTNAIFTGVKTSGAHMQHGDLSVCQTLIQKQLDQMFLGEDVKLPKGLNHPQKGTKYYKIYTTYDDFINAYYEWLDETGY